MINILKGVFVVVALMGMAQANAVPVVADFNGGCRTIDVTGPTEEHCKQE